MFRQYLEDSDENVVTFVDGVQQQQRAQWRVVLGAAWWQTARKRPSEMTTLVVDGGGCWLRAGLGGSASPSV